MENQENNFTQEEVIKSIGNFVFPSACSKCKHKEVCSLRENYEKNHKLDEPFCIHFLSADTYKTYSSVNDLFLPIFDWMQYHYPHGEVKFIVDNRSAQMLIEHGVNAFSRDIRMCSENQLGYYKEQVENKK